MKERLRQTERRLDRRIPLGCPARIVLRGGRAIEAVCVDLSVGGMSLRSGYVPNEGESFEVEVLQPATRAAGPSLRARVTVRRCHPLGEGRYELGVAIVEVLA